MGFIKNFIYFLIIILDRIWPKKAIPVLLYHSISDDGSRLSVNKKNFEKQLNFLSKNGYQSMGPDELYQCLNQGQVPNKKIIITFDDGYQDNYTQALPILKKYNFSAIIFIATKFIGQKASFATDKINQDKKILDFNEIKDLAEEGIIISNHFHSHLPLTGLNKEQITNEYHTAQNILKNFNHRNIYPEIVAYPKNRVNQEIINCLKNLNVLLGFSGSNKAINKSDFRLNLSRIEIYQSDSILKFSAKLTAYYSLFKIKKL